MVVIHINNLSTKEVVAGRWRVQYQPELYGETLSQTKTTPILKNEDSEVDQQLKALHRA